MGGCPSIKGPTPGAPWAECMGPVSVRPGEHPHEKPTRNAGGHAAARRLHVRLHQPGREARQRRGGRAHGGRPLRHRRPVAPRRRDGAAEEQHQLPDLPRQRPVLHARAGPGSPHAPLQQGDHLGAPARHRGRLRRRGPAGERPARRHAAPLLGGDRRDLHGHPRRVPAGCADGLRHRRGHGRAATRRSGDRRLRQLHRPVQLLVPGRAGGAPPPPLRRRGVLVRPPGDLRRRPADPVHPRQQRGAEPHADAPHAPPLGRWRHRQAPPSGCSGRRGPRCRRS